MLTPECLRLFASRALSIMTYTIGRIAFRTDAAFFAARTQVEIAHSAKGNYENPGIAPSILSVLVWCNMIVLVCIADKGKIVDGFTSESTQLDCDIPNTSWRGVY